ncbi:MAG: hypothetical protein CL661_10150 [Bacteroidetes bacterium]|jgi:hypothetical protein|nr:hypothetical protein [Bacteroidota bacterium]
MKKLNLIIALLMIFGIVSLSTSCKKDEQQIADNTSASADDAFAEGIYSDATNIVDEAYDNGSGGLKSGNTSNLFLSGCATVTLDTTVTPRELTIDFGEENCLCLDGKKRRGKIIVTFTGRYRWPGTVITYGFDNYHVNDNHVDGTKIIRNMGLNANNKLHYNIEVVGVIYKADNGGTLSWNSSRVREWIHGAFTFPHWDDVYLITGTADGIRPNGQTWEREIVSPLRVELNCKWIVSGTMEIKPEGLPLRILDFGSGECDNIATVLVNGITYTIFLH